MFSCIGFSSSKKTQITPILQEGDVIHIWENKQKVNSIKIGEPTYNKKTEKYNK
jgi:hypothetical protein